jgi:transposase
VLDAGVDVGLDEVHLVTDFGDGLTRRTVRNLSEDLAVLCQWFVQVARLRGYSGARVVLEPTGIYHELLRDVARRHGIEVRTVQGEAVKNMRAVMFGDYGKTDSRDPKVILELAYAERLIRQREVGETFEALRCSGQIYARAERDAVRAKNRIHRCRRRVFPDFGFSNSFLFSASGLAVMKVTKLDPVRIVKMGRARLTKKVRELAPRIQGRSIDRLLAAAAISAESVERTAATELTVLEIEQAYEDLELAESRKAVEKKRLEALYDKAQTLDDHLPAPQKGLVSKLNLARLVGETGPWSDFDSVNQLLKYTGLNLYEQQSGRWRGKTRISKKGRALARHVVSQIVVPLVRRGRLLGAYHHQKREVEKKAGAVAITASVRKTIDILWGWGRSGQEFDPKRVFTCESQMTKVA